MLVKKYGNRRLYDTDSSQYITLAELAAKILAGADARVVDAKSGRDLTPETLTQIIMEARGGESLLPIGLLHQLIRLGDDALADFLGRYVQGALEVYLQARKSAQTLMPFNPFLTSGNPFTNAPWVTSSPRSTQPAAPLGGPSDVELLRREVDELKKSLIKKKKR